MKRLLHPLTAIVAMGLLLATAAGAATGLLSVGSVIPGGGDPGFEHDGPSPRQTVIATGETPVGGPWRLTSYRSEGIVDDRGDLAEPEGLPCIRFLLTDPPATNPINGSAFCLAPGKREFNLSSVPVVDDSSGGAEVIVYGFAPRAAATVQLTSARGERIRADTTSGGSSFPGAVWVLAAPPGTEAAELDWLDRSEKPAGERLRFTAAAG